jgi:hypothetical protein
MDKQSLGVIRERISRSREQNDRIKALLPKGVAPSIRANLHDALSISLSSTTQVSLESPKLRHMEQRLPC